jgi:hypothetical protein
MAGTSVTVAALQRVKMSDGSYAIVLPINTTDEVYVDINENKTLTGELSNINVTITTDRDGLIDDMLTLVSQLAPFLTKPLNLNHIQVEDFTNTTNITLTSGGFEPGCLFM